MKIFENNSDNEIRELNSWRAKFTHEGANIVVSIENYTERADIREKAIHFVGNIEGFLSLRDILNYCTNEFLDAKLDIDSLPFVNNAIGKKLLIEFCDNEEQEFVINVESKSGITVESEEAIIWKLSWSETAQIITLMHGFLYEAWNHLHLDPESIKSKYAVVLYLSKK